MTQITFEIKHGEKLDYTFDFTEDCNALSQTIDGTPIVTVAPSSPALTVSSVTVDATVKKASIVVTAPASGDLEYTLSCKANITGSPDRDFVQGIILRIVPAVPSAPGGAVTVGRVISELGITDAAVQALVPDWILDATEAIEKYLGFPLDSASTTEAVAGYGGTLLQMSRRPITAITSISFGGVTLDPDTYTIYNAQAGQIWLSDGAYQTAPLRSNLSALPYLDSEKAYSVVYTAGWIMPGVSGATLPRDIQRAALDLVRGIMNAPSNPNVKRESVDGVYSVEYFDSSASADNLALPKSVANVLNQYRMLPI